MTTPAPTPPTPPTPAARREARRSRRLPTVGDGSRVDRSPDHGQGSGERRIRCPRCGWRPRAWDLWSCLCGCAWNTFETRGRCPDCGRRWQVTQCLACHAYSPHEEWYADEPEGA